MNKKLFWVILLVAFALRFYKLGEIPRGIDWDEASNGYNAYSILKTARDEYGSFLPLTNRSFDDYKPPLYMYLNVPTVALFGLTPFAVRLPSAFFGALTVALIYFLAKRLFENNRLKYDISALSMLMLAISPWHIQLSRAAFEANVGLFFVVASFTSLLYAINTKKSILFFISAIFFGLGFYSYHSVRIFSPLLFLLTVIIFRKEIFKYPKKLLFTFGLIVILIVLPFFIFTPNKAISQRFETTTQKSQITDIEKSIKFMLQDEESQIPLSNIIHNRRLVIAQTVFANYLSHFDFNFLFTKGDDNFRHHIENMGMLYLYQLPLILYGIYLLIKNIGKETAFLLGWLMIAPLPASFGDAVPHAVRSLSLVIPLQIISALALLNILKTIKFKKIFALILVFIVFFSLISYLHNHYAHYSKDHAGWWQYGYLQAANDTEALKNQYEKIVVDRSVEQGYIFWLFATKYDPGTYQKEGTKDHFDKYYFGSEEQTSNIHLYVGVSLPDEFEVTKTIYYPNGKEAIKIGHPI